MFVMAKDHVVRYICSDTLSIGIVTVANVLSACPNGIQQTVYS